MCAIWIIPIYNTLKAWGNPGKKHNFKAHQVDLHVMISGNGLKAVPLSLLLQTNCRVQN